MLFSRGLRCPTLLVLCLPSILLPSQTTSAPEQPATQSGAQVATAGSAQTMPAWRVDQWNTFQKYQNLFRYMCIEDQLIQKHSKTEDGQRLTRTDYSSAIGISESDEQVMLNIILDGCHRTDENEKQYKASNYSQSVYPSWAHTQFDILKQTWTQLQQSLTPAELKNLDAYINKNFTFPRYPDQPDSRRKSIAYEFQTFIQDVNDRDIENQRLIASGQKPQEWDYSREAHFPEEKEQAVLTIVLDAGRQLRERDRKINEELAAWQQKTPCANKHPLDLNCPVPPELRALDANGVSIVMQTVSRLRLELGEESFDNLDKWISQTSFGGR